MNKRLIMILAVVFVAAFAMAAYAEVQNIKVGGDMLMRAVALYDFNTGATPVASGYDEKEDAFVSHIRVRVDADLTDNVAATVRLLNERVWGDPADAGSDTDIALDLAYVTLKEFLYSPLTLVVGRQELRYGNALIIGDVDTNGFANSSTPLTGTLGALSLRKSFDAAKAILNYDPLVIDLVLAKTEENTTTIADDVRLLGVNAAYTVNANLLAEAYLWSRDREHQSTGLAIIAGQAGQGERLNTLGARGLFTGIENLVLGLEGAWQFGDHVTSATLYPNDARATDKKSKVNAYALQFVSSYSLPMRYSPVLGFTYTRLSGDKDRLLSDNYKGWDPMYEDQAGGTIFNSLLGYSNAQLFNLNGTLKPMDDVTVKLDYYHIRLLQTFNTNTDIAKLLSGVAATTNTVVQPLERHLADEVDLNVMYDYTEDVQFGLLLGAYFPGQVYDNSNDDIANQVIGSMKVTF